ncbi:MAG: hypothetical protein EU539_01220 [Promethearchaeota archaeon]|nr:MAG: hypothetical protein EU539_01220 [Candidatus Lokiarchaeota archaeon]
MNKRRLINLIGILLILVSGILLISSIYSAFLLREQRLKFFKNEEIFFESFHVETRDNVMLNGMIFADKEDKKLDDNSVPTILIINGINAKIDLHLYKMYQLVKLGYAVLIAEQRGHGESGGPSGFLSKEPKDMEEFIDFIEDTYDFCNTTHLGLLGFSYGGGIGAILQARDDRIHVSVLYHPLTSLDGVTERIPFQNLVGSTPAIKSIDEIKDATKIADEENSKNILIIQGLEDELIDPEESEDFYDNLDGPQRDDIALEKRPGLNHGENEEDEDSFKYAIIWLEHFFHDQTIDISNRDDEIKKISLEEFNYPENQISEILLILSIILLFFGINIVILRSIIMPLWKNKSFQKIKLDTNEKIQDYKRMIKLRTIVYVLAVIGAGLLCSMFNRSLVYGYFLLYPIITIIIMLFIPSELHSNWKEEWKNWIKNDSKLFIINLCAIMIPMILFLIIFSLNASIMLKPPINFLNSTAIIYIFIFFGSVIMDFVYLREWKPRHTLIIIILRPLTLILFVLFVPIKPFPILGGLISFILFISLIGVIFWYARQFSLVMARYYKNYVSTYGLILFPVVIIMLYLFFRIL